MNKSSALSHHFQSITPSTPSKNTKSKKTTKQVNKFDSGLTNPAFRQAAESGYLISPSRNYLLDRCWSPDKRRSLKEIHYIHLSYSHIRTLGHIQACKRLKICILHNNYLTKFNALYNCPELIRLDLHSNQISSLPDGAFWSRMCNLEVLNLHDNGIGDLESVQHLSECPNLTILTLYDTPLCLKPNYRHHTVNSIWTLKALDHHVVSDEEIIEDAMFTKRFSAFSPALRVDLCPKEVVPVEERTLSLELSVVQQIMSRVNRILLHGSPVIVIQRWFRGHLARRRRGMKYGQIISKIHPIVKSGAPQPTPGDGMSIDYDTYMENRRPGSKTPSAATNQRSESPATSAQLPQEKVSQSGQSFPTVLHINLAKLEKLALQKLETPCESPDAMDIKKVEFIDTGRESRVPEKSRLSFTRDTPQQAFRRSHPTVQQMLGPNVKLVQPPLISDDGDQLWVNGEQPQHKWRVHRDQFHLRGGHVPKNEMDPLEQHLIMNRDAGQDVREAEEYWHEERDNIPLPKVKRSATTTKLRDDVSLATLVAVSKAYRDRDKANQLAGKMDQVMRIHQEKMQARHIVNAYKEERRNAALNQRQEDRLRVTQALQQNEMARNAYVEQAQERKDKALQRQRMRQTDLMFASDFNNQHTSVSSALVRHDRQSNVEDLVAKKREVVRTIQMQLTEQADLVKRYMEHKQLMQQLASGQERAEVGTQALREANERLLFAKQRVAGIKARKAAVRAYHHQVPTTSQLSDCPIVLSRNSLPSDALHGSSTFISQMNDHSLAPHTTPRNSTVIPPNESDHKPEHRSITAPHLRPHFNYLLKT